MRSRLWLLALVLTACQTETAPEPAPADSSDAALAVDSAAEVPDAVADTSQGTTAVQSVLALDTEGLRLVNAESGSTRPLAFGGAEEEVVAVLTRVLGTAPERGVNGECGAGPMAIAQWTDGLTLLFSDGTFAGWAVDGDRTGADAYQTMAGIGPGSTRAEMAEVSEVAVEETSLGTEFASGDLYGILSGPGADARVTQMWAGTSCVFR